MRHAAPEEDRLARPDLEGEDRGTSARKMTQIAPAPPSASATAMRGLTACRRRRRPKIALITGVSVKTAEAETGGAVFRPSNIVTK
jgi:hypothetical protein